MTGVLVLPSGEGYTIDLSLPEEKINRARMAPRSMEGRTGCGLCGIEDMKDAIRMPGGTLPRCRSSRRPWPAPMSSCPPTSR